MRKEKRRGGRSFYPLKKQKCEQEIQTSVNEDRDIVYCSELITKLMSSSPCIIPPGESLENSREAIITESREGILTRLSNAITKELYLIVEWAKLVPGFDALCRKDQIALLTAGGMELIVFRVIYRSIPYKEHVYMNTTTLLVREDCYSVLNKEIVDMILDVVERLRPLAMDQVEFACLKTILLADPGNILSRHFTVHHDERLFSFLGCPGIKLFIMSKLSGLHSPIKSLPFLSVIHAMPSTQIRMGLIDNFW